MKKKVVKDDGSAEQLKLCAKLLAELQSQKQHVEIAHPFYEPIGEYQILSVSSCCLSDDFESS